jgi:hypothetical protein
MGLDFSCLTTPKPQSEWSLSKRNPLSTAVIWAFISPLASQRPRLIIRDGHFLKRILLSIAVLYGPQSLFHSQHATLFELELLVCFLTNIDTTENVLCISNQETILPSDKRKRCARHTTPIDQYESKRRKREKRVKFSCFFFSPLSFSLTQSLSLTLSYSLSQSLSLTPSFSVPHYNISLM